MVEKRTRVHFGVDPGETREQAFTRLIGDARKARLNKGAAVRALRDHLDDAARYRLHELRTQRIKTRHGLRAPKGLMIRWELIEECVRHIERGDRSRARGWWTLAAATAHERREAVQVVAGSLQCGARPPAHLAWTAAQQQVLRAVQEHDWNGLLATFAHGFLRDTYTVAGCPAVVFMTAARCVCVAVVGHPHVHGTIATRDGTTCIMVDWAGTIPPETLPRDAHDVMCDRLRAMTLA